MKVYQFLYCPCIWESAFGTISLHRTKKGAQEAMKAHKAEKRAEFDELYVDAKPHRLIKFGLYEAWKVEAIELQD